MNPPRLPSRSPSPASALVGIAINQGRIGVNEPITRYMPELLNRDLRFERITLRKLLTMSSGLKYQEAGTPWSDDTATYYSPDLRALALEQPPDREASPESVPVQQLQPPACRPGMERPPACPSPPTYSVMLWQPIGTEADGSWSLDSTRAASRRWRAASTRGRATSPGRHAVRQRRRLAGPSAGPARLGPGPLPAAPTDDGSLPAPGYGFFWWVQSDRRPPAFFARGKYAQHIYVVPESRLVLVRFGSYAGYQHWPQLLSNLASRLAR